MFTKDIRILCLGDIHQVKAKLQQQDMDLQIKSIIYSYGIFSRNVHTRVIR